MKEKGRNWKLRGENNPKSKLKTKEVLEIRKLYKQGYDSKYLANLFNLHPMSIPRIANGRRWKYV